MSKNWFIYKHTFPNKKVYIGISSQKHPNSRWGSDGYKYHTQPLMLHAILKYGWLNVSHEILEKGLSKKEAQEKETYYIELYKSCDYKFGYNVSKGASVFSTETFPRRKSLPTEEQKLATHHLRSESIKKSWEDPNVREKRIQGIKSVSQTSEYREKLSQALKKACAKEEFRKQKSEIMKKRYEDENYRNFIKTTLSKVNRNRCRKVICVETGVVYNSIKEAGELSGVSFGTIKHILNKTVKNSKTHWEYIDEVKEK